MILRTHGADTIHRKTLVIDGNMDHPFFGFLDQLLALALDDNAFDSRSAQHVANIFHAAMPPGRCGIMLKWKRRALDLPVFREPMRGPRGSGTSPSKPLRARTYARRLISLGRMAGFQENLGQKWFRRGLLNVVNRIYSVSSRRHADR